MDYKELCHLDVLGLSDTLPNDQSSVYAEFKEQLVRHEEGWYETGLLGEEIILCYQTIRTEVYEDLQV